MCVHGTNKSFLTTKETAALPAVVVVVELTKDSCSLNHGETYIYRDKCCLMLIKSYPIKESLTEKQMHKWTNSDFYFLFHFKSLHANRRK